jgi:hypothetical protein
MKRVSILLLTITLSVGIAFASSGSKMTYKAFTPTGAATSALLQSGTKQVKYSVVEKGTTLSFDITGPATVKIRTRAEFKPDASNIAYEGQIWEGENLIVDRKVKASVSKLTLPGQNIGIFNARDLIIKVPDGKHSYRLWLISDKIDRYYTRFYRAE